MSTIIYTQGCGVGKSVHANDQVEHVMIYFFLNSASCRPLNRGVGYGVEVLHADIRVY